MHPHREGITHLYSFFFIGLFILHERTNERINEHFKRERLATAVGPAAVSKCGWLKLMEKYVLSVYYVQMWDRPHAVDQGDVKSLPVVEQYSRIISVQCTECLEAS